jgi:nitrate/nitrite transport system substrate-binding protein
MSVTRIASWLAKKKPERLEKPVLHLGFIPLTDCAVLAVAHEKGYFERYGLNVTLHKEASWATIRDKVSVGLLDGAQMLSPMPLAATLGLGAKVRPMLTAVALSANGNAITVSNALWGEMSEAAEGGAGHPRDSRRELKQVILCRKQENRDPLTFAVVAPFSMHQYLLRDWLAGGDIDPDRDVRILVIPPQYLPDNLENGLLDGFCVGEPWNTVAVRRGLGRTVIATNELFPNAQEKVLGVTHEWAEKYPQTHIALVKSVLEAAEWCEKAGNRSALASLLSKAEYVGEPFSSIAPGLTGQYQFAQSELPVSIPDFHVFSRADCNSPSREHGAWLGRQMLRWGQLDDASRIPGAVQQTYRPDLYEQAAV